MINARAAKSLPKSRDQIEPVGSFIDDMGRTIRVSWELITPEYAEEILERNTEFNRNLSSNQVKDIRADLVEGHWMFNGSTLCFDAEDYLLDGQHRMTAIAESGIAVRLLVVRGLDPDAMHVMGQDRPRSTSDLLRTSGRLLVNDTTVISIASLVSKLDPNLRNVVRTRPRLADYAWEHRSEFEPVASWARTLVHQTDLTIDPRNAFSNGRAVKKAVSISVLGSLVYIMIHRHGASEEDVHAYWDSVLTGIAITDDDRDHIRAVRNYLRITSPMVRFGGGGTLGALPKLFDTLIMNYNHWVVGETIRRIVPRRQEITEYSSITKARRNSRGNVE